MALLLNSFGVNQEIMQDEYLRWLVNKSASHLYKKSAENDLSSLPDTVDKCLPLIGNQSYSPLWIILLDKIAACCHDACASQLYEKIDQTIFGLVLKGETPSLSILLQLWQTHLPSLEFMVIQVLGHISQGFPSNTLHPVSSQDILEKSLLIRAAQHEPSINHILQCMLYSLLKHQHLAPTVRTVLKTLTGHCRDRASASSSVI